MENSNLETVRQKLFSSKSASEQMNDEIRMSVNRIREEQLKRLKPSLFKEQEDFLSDEDYQKVSELADFMREYVKIAGKEQAVLDMQVGINLLNNYRKESFVESKIQLKEDSDYGEKTFKAMFNVLKNYPLDVVKRFVKLGAINNHIWRTKNNIKVDTDGVVEAVSIALDERGV